MVCQNFCFSCFCCHKKEKKFEPQLLLFGWGWVHLHTSFCGIKGNGECVCMCGCCSEVCEPLTIVSFPVLDASQSTYFLYTSLGHRKV